MRTFTFAMACLVTMTVGLTVECSLAADHTPPSLRAWQRSHEGHLTIEWAETARVQQKRQGDKLILRFATPLGDDIESVLLNISNFVESNRTTIEGKDLSLALKAGVSSKVKIRERNIVTVEFSLDPTYKPQIKFEASSIDNGVRLVLEWPGPTEVKANQNQNEVCLKIVPPRIIDPAELAKLQQTLRPWFHRLRSEKGLDHTTLSLGLEPQVAVSIKPEGVAKTVVDFVRNASPQAAPQLQTKGQVFIPAVKPSLSTGAAKAQKAGPLIPMERPRKTKETVVVADADAKTVTAADADEKRPKTLVFDWKKPVGAAIFVRAEHLWIIFDEPDTGLLTSLPPPPPAFGPSMFVPADGGTALRFPLLKPVHVSVSQTAENRWQIEPTSSSSTPQSLIVERVNGSTTLRVTPVSGEHIVSVVDPAVGDRLDVLPLRDLGIGQPEMRRFVDLELLPTVQGLAWRRLNDRLTANIENEGLKFSSPDGLLLSATDAAPSDRQELIVLEAMAKKKLQSDQPKKDEINRPAVKPIVPFPQDAKSVAAKPSSYFDLADSAVERELVNEHRRIRRQAIGKAPPESKDHARLSLARLLVTERLANEARTILGTISGEADDHIILQKRALNGVSALLIGHLAEATALLLDPGLNDDNEVEVWRAALESIEDNWLPAAERWRTTSDILDKYPPRLKLDLGLMALRAAIETDDDNMMRRGTRRLKSLALSPYDEARVDAMKALKAERTGDLAKARALLADLATSHNQTVRALAEFELAAIDLKADNGDPGLLQSLDRRMPIWRGHPQEQSMLDKLARRYRDANALREALTTWERLARLFPETAHSEDLKKARQDTFSQALANATEPAIDRLDVYAIYLDFIDLLPDEPEARDILRHLARHLTELDLLAEAIDVLQSLMTSTDDNLERSKLAIEIAKLMLQQDRATLALSVLDGSEGSRLALPPTLDEERHLIRAHALVRLGRTDDALRALKDLQSDPARRLRAKVLWDERRWPRLAAVIESYFADADPSSPLTHDDQKMVLWLALAHQQEDIPEKLHIFRDRFAATMQGGPYADAFDVATQSTARASDIRALLAATEDQLAELQRFRKTTPTLP